MNDKKTKGLWFVLDFIVYGLPVIGVAALSAIVKELVDIYNG